MRPAAAPLIMCMPGYIRGVATARVSPHPAAASPPPKKTATGSFTSQTTTSSFTPKLPPAVLLPKKQIF